MTQYETEDSRAKWPSGKRDNATNADEEMDDYPQDDLAFWLGLRNGLIILAFLGALIVMCCSCQSTPKPVTSGPVWVTPAFGGTTNELPPWPTP